MALAQPAGGADAGKTGADDQDVEVFGARWDVGSLGRQQIAARTNPTAATGAEHLGHDQQRDTLRCTAPPAPRVPGVVATLVR
jgi:hypothetical protein